MDPSGRKRRKPDHWTRARAEQALRESEERFRTLVQFSFDVYWETDAQHRFTRQEFSDRLADAPTAGSEIGKTRWEVPYLEPDEEAWRRHRATLDAHLPFRDFELARPTADGGKRYVSVSGMPVFDGGGRFVGYRGVGRHITGFKRAEAELRAQQEMLDLAQKAARAVAFDWHIGARESENRWSPELEAMYGLEPGTFDRTFRGWKKLVHPDDWPAVKLAIERAQQSGDVAAEYRVIHKDGSVHWLRARGRMFFDAAGQPERMVGFMIDVTDWRHVEEELRASEARFRTFVDHARDAFFLMDEKLTVVDVNRQACESLGYRREELLGMHPHDFDIGLDQPSIEGLAERAGGGETVTFETLHRRKDGSAFPVEIRTSTFPQAGHLFYLALVRDISERRRAEEEHRAYLWFLESMDRINRAIQGTDGLDRMMSAVLEATLDIFACDRAWLVYPCDPEAPSWRAIVEHTRPEYPGAFALQEALPMDAEVAAVFEKARASPGPVLFGAPYDLKIPGWAAERFAIRSQMAMAIEAKGDKRHLFGLHQCSHARVWTGEEQRLFQEIGRRLGDAIAALSMLRSVRDSERRLEAAQRIAHVGWWERDFATNRVSLSEETQRIFGVPPIDLPRWQDRWVNLIHPEDRARAADAAAAAKCGGPRYDVEYRVIRPDGAVRVVHSQGDVTWDESGRAVRQFGVMQDITELRRTEDELSEIRERFRVLAESSLTGIYLTENERFSYVNPALAKMFGYAVEEIVGRLGSTDLTCPDDRPLVAQNMRRRLEGEVEEMRYEFRGLRKDGSLFPVEVHGRRIVHGGKIGVLGTLIDVSERKRAEESLRESEAYLTEAQRLSHTGSWALDVASNRYLYTSEEFDRIFGLDPDREELTREAILERMHPEDRISWKRILEKSVREKLDTASQYRIVLPDGSIRHIHTIRHPVVNSAGEVVKLVGTSIDITERKLAEENLRASHAAVRESEQRYRTVFEKANDALFLENDRDDIVEVNERACALLGYSRDELLKMKVPDLQAPEIRGQAGRVVREEIDKHGSATFESVDLHCSGRRIPVEVTNTEISDRGEKLVLSIVRDITERKRAEETLRQKDHSLQIAREELARVSRVTTLGELTASIAHEVNQPLGAMVANAAACTRWLAADPPAASKAQRALESIAADGRRASEIIGRIRALVKRQAPRKDLVDVNLKIAQVIEVAADEIRRSGVVLRTALAEALPRVEGDRVQLQQVLLNLILNAVEAMSSIRDRPRELTLASRCEGEQDVLIEVRDTGPGIDPDSAERLFEPFYTTKAQGLGMGLSISRSIVEAHGGRLWAGSNQPHGAVFRFSLPVAGRRDHESCIGS